MGRARSAEDFVADIRQRADMVGSAFVSDDEILEYFNQELAELRMVIRRAEGQAHVRGEDPITVSAGTSDYPLPAGFGELIGVWIVRGGRKAPLKPYMEFEEAALRDRGVGGPMYRLVGDNIRFLPTSENFTATIVYMPAEPRLQFSPGVPNTFDGYNGYEVAAIYGAVATCLAKEESDPSFYLAQKDRIIKSIQANAANRDAGQPERVQDVVGWDPWRV